MSNSLYYVKSLEEDFATKTLKGEEKIVCQTISEIIKTKILKPNTKSFGREKRLSCTILSDEYLKTYRPHGIIFTTNEKPDYVIPFDLVLVSATEKIVVHYYRIKNTLHVYYNHKLIPGFEKFLFKNFENLIKEYPSPQKAWKGVNEFRVKQGYQELPLQKFRLVEYNEAVFHKQIGIKPIALFGYHSETRKLAKELNLPVYSSAKQFYENKFKEKITLIQH